MKHRLNPQAKKATRYILIGRVSRAVGLDGRIEIQSDGDIFPALDFPAPLYLVPIANPNRAFPVLDHLPKETVPITIEDIHYRRKKIGFVVYTREAKDRDEAERLKGLSVYIDQDNVPMLPEGEFYGFELVGFSVYCKGVRIGEVRRIWNYASVSSFEVRSNRGEKYLIPFIEKKVIEQIDLHRKEIALAEIDIADYIDFS